jgi:hypothetical protein
VEIKIRGLSSEERCVYCKAGEKAAELQKEKR